MEMEQTICSTKKRFYKNLKISKCKQLKCGTSSHLLIKVAYESQIQFLASLNLPIEEDLYVRNLKFYKTNTLLLNSININTPVKLTKLIN